MKENEIISEIESLIDQISYKSASVSIVLEGKTITIEKTQKDKKNPMGFCK